MHKLITLTDEQWTLMQELMKEHYHSSVSAFVVSLMSEAKRNKARVSGRPRKRTDEETAEDDGIARYQAPDYPKTKSPYTKGEVDSWYNFRGLPVPEDAYKQHPEVEA